MPENSPSLHAPRHAILDLAPLELDCMTAIWALGAGTVRDVQDRLMPTRPRAYTTVMTIMDRLAQKGIVSRQKVGRAYRYQANLSSDEARNSAVQKVVAGFFNGSTEALASHLAGFKPPAAENRKSTSKNDPGLPEPLRIESHSRSFPEIAAIPSPTEIENVEVSGEARAPERLDESLL